MSHWHAGWNMPGYLPDEPYASFESKDQARGYLVDAYERAWDSGTDEEYLDGHCELHLGTDTVYAAGYVYQVYECGDDGCAPDED